MPLAKLPHTHRDVSPSHPRRFDAATIGLHWATALVIVGMFTSAWLHAQASDGASAGLLLTIHRSLGVTVWTLVVIRLAWRTWFATVPPFPGTMPRSQQIIATLSEYALYALLLLQPITGLAQSLTRGKPFVLFGLEAPVVMARDKALTALLHQTHEVTAWALLGLIGLHFLAALFHGFVLRDEVLPSMLPWKPSSSSRALNSLGRE
jgi:cytochrome b561